MKKVIIYSTPTCTYCLMAKDFFREKGVEFEEIDVSGSEEKREDEYRWNLNNEGFLVHNRPPYL